MIEQLRLPGSEQRWQEFCTGYGDWLRRWLKQYGATPDAADDIVQEVMCVVLEKIPDFVHNGRQGAFRRWLKTIVVLQLRKYRRSPRSRSEASGVDFAELAAQLESKGNHVAVSWEQQENREIVRALLSQVATSFEARSIEAFRRVVLQQHDARTVADELGMSLNAVTVAKSKIMRALRVLGEGML